jgi:hypothetical protein
MLFISSFFGLIIFIKVFFIFYLFFYLIVSFMIYAFFGKKYFDDKHDHVIKKDDKKWYKISDYKIWVRWC